MLVFVLVRALDGCPIFCGYLFWTKDIPQHMTDHSLVWYDVYLLYLSLLPSRHAAANCPCSFSSLPVYSPVLLLAEYWWRLNVKAAAVDANLSARIHSSPSRVSASDSYIDESYFSIPFGANVQVFWSPVQGHFSLAIIGHSFYLPGVIWYVFHALLALPTWEAIW